LQALSQLHLLKFTGVLLSIELHDEHEGADWPLVKLEIHRNNWLLFEVECFEGALVVCLGFEYLDVALVEAHNEFVALRSHPFRCNDVSHQEVLLCEQD